QAKAGPDGRLARGDVREGRRRDRSRRLLGKPGREEEVEASARQPARWSSREALARHPVQLPVWASRPQLGRTSTAGGIHTMLKKLVIAPFAALLLAGAARAAPLQTLTLRNDPQVADKGLHAHIVEVHTHRSPGAVIATDRLYGVIPGPAIGTR